MSHIALLLPELEVGGAQRVMFLLASEFAARGHQVDLVLLRASGPLLSAVPDGVRLVDLVARKHGFGQLGFTLSSVCRLAAWLRWERPNAILSTIVGANLVALLARKIAGVPLKLVIRQAASVKSVSSIVRFWSMWWLYPQADAVIALSSVMAKGLTQQLGVSTTKIYCIANPVDAAFIRKQSQMPLEHPWLDDVGLRVMISVGRLIPEKDYATLLRAFALLPNGLPARLIILGEGPERAMLERLVLELAIADRVQLVGFDVNPWRWMARADMFVLSSRSEGHPNVLLEARVLGLPVVVAEYDASVSDMVTRYGFSVVPVGEPEALAHIMNLLIRQGVRPPSANVEMPSGSVESYLAALVVSATSSSNKYS